MAQKNISTFALILLLILGFGACSQKKYFNPKDAQKTSFNQKLSAPIIYTNRNSAQLKNNSVIEKNNDEHFVLHKKWRFLNSENYQGQKIYIAQNGCKEIMIISESSAQVLDSQNAQSTQINFDKCIVSAAYKHIENDTFLALQAQDNSIYVFKNNAQVFSHTLSSANAISMLHATPIFTQGREQKIVFPSLDGRVLIYDIKAQKIARDILIASDKFFNNIIYLQAKNDLIIAATSKRISVILDNAKTFNFDGDFRDVKMHENLIYVLSNDGKILELDNTLKLLRQTKFEYARLFGIVVANNHLYTLERNKYLIELDLQDFSHKIFKLNLPNNKKLFYTNDTIYYHNKKKSF